MSSINLFEILPPTLIQLILSKSKLSDLVTLYNLNYNVRLSILDLIYIGRIYINSGKVYASGNGTDGKLGNGHIIIHKEETPIPIDTTNIGYKRVIKASAGYDYSLFVCEDGTVYASGLNILGRLGIGNNNNRPVGTPTQIDTTNIGDKRVIDVSASYEHSLFLCEDGTVYVSGDRSEPKLGIGITDGNPVGIPIEIDTSNIGDKSVIGISAGSYHSLFLT